MSDTASHTRINDLAAPLIEKSLERAQRATMAERRARLHRQIDATNNSPSLFWRHPYFADVLPGMFQPLSTDIIVEKIAAQIDRQKRRIAERHWTGAPGKLVTLKEAMVFARYYRRFSKQVWARKAS